MWVSLFENRTPDLAGDPLFFLKMQGEKQLLPICKVEFDTITVHDAVTNISTADGNDSITIPAAGIEAAPTIAAGGDTDTITLSDVTTGLVDADFANISAAENKNALTRVERR